MKCKNVTTGQVVLIRAYGKKSELLIDRQSELLVSMELARISFFIALDVYRFERGWSGPTIVLSF